MPVAPPHKLGEVLRRRYEKARREYLGAAILHLNRYPAERDLLEKSIGRYLARAGTEKAAEAVRTAASEIRLDVDVGKMARDLCSELESIRRVLHPDSVALLSSYMLSVAGYEVRQGVLHYRISLEAEPEAAGPAEAVETIEVVPAESAPAGSLPEGGSGGEGSGGGGGGASGGAGDQDEPRTDVVSPIADPPAAPPADPPSSSGPPADLSPADPPPADPAPPKRGTRKPRKKPAESRD